MYIIVRPEIEEFNYLGQSLGMSAKLAVFFSPSIGRKRFYRQNISHPSKGLKTLTFKTEKGAQRVCDRVNDASNGGWSIEKI